MAWLLVVVALVMAPLLGCTAITTSPGVAAGPRSTHAPSGTDAESGLAWVRLDDLPAQAARTVALIDRGGPFPYTKDGTVFRNAEALLPHRARGYYHEYTVPTPGEHDRGARRIVAGNGGELYWTGDHYASFQRIRR